MRPPGPDKPPDGRFLRLMTAVGGLDSPHYDDERARYVWYEASAIGVNLALWGGLVLASVMIWVGGAPLLWWSLALFGLTMLIAIATTQYAARRRVHIDLDDTDVRSPVMMGVMLLVMAYVVGLGRAASELTGPHQPGAGGGWIGVVGAVAGGVIAVIWSARSQARKQARRAAREAAESDD